MNINEMLKMFVALLATFSYQIAALLKSFTMVHIPLGEDLPQPQPTNSGILKWDAYISPYTLFPS